MFKACKSLILVLSCALSMPLALADELLRADHPDQYTVVKGDTLWDISGRFLRSPWRWPDIWYVNPQIANPHLIYPGDVLELVYIDGKPQLRMRRGPLKLSPTVRSTPWDGAIPTIPVDAIGPFLTRPYVLDKDQLDGAPYIVDFADEHILGGAGQKAYVRRIDQTEPLKYEIVRPGGPYKDADTGEILGYEALYIGTSELQRTGDPATVFINSTDLESVIGDRLIPAGEEKATANFTPHAPAQPVEGSIIAVMNGVSQIGQYNVVVLDRGARDGLAPGTVLRVDQRGELIRDVVTPDSRDKVQLPDEEAGLLMVFRTFERVSFGLVMHASRVMHVNDRVRNP
ncbi:MAG: LysM peptidoglycan-binding domain-containing protein [Chromatiaceae bacterium]|nr:LysM peptidoglycan-binding domain-containing protein [Gammaproteobacteria bacterium]MCP5318443.1 LysM peptidoglycan-binding domain-containing protein [Chromatiaceae bacterium]MCW5585005.1 LysM peptidoglycan-binding domain-containing protein [Chromatiales bacterium]HOP17687.1 LysM peptidoglycan-binding domain-containing protein [Gammaproteobacteria bacterium]HPQ24769.1 LysM peptidoglycan-binding domain-containing protein [Gammaproteobacteria bacterium]